MTIKTTRAFTETLKITLVVGSQQFSSPNFTVEVFDCTKFKELVPSIKVQMNSPQTKYSAFVLEGLNEDCGTRLFNM